MYGEELAAGIGGISFTVSFAVAAELKASALRDGLKRDELIATVMLIYVLLLLLQTISKRVFDGLFNLVKNNTDDDPRLAAIKDDRGDHTVLSFIQQVVMVAIQITVSLAVQLITEYVGSEQATGQARMISLVTLAVFFMFFEWSAGLLRL